MDGSILLNGKLLDWLLDPGEPGARYLAMRDLQQRPADDPELLSTRHDAHRNGPIRVILDNMQSEGFWVKPGAGYSPKYTSTVWSLVLLAQLGASVVEDERISIACRYLLDHALSPGGQFSYNGTPSGTIDCLQGNLLWALLELGYDDPRMMVAYEWMARTVLGEGVAPKTEKDAERRYYVYKCGPGFMCGANNNQPCAWGAAKVMLAFGQLPVNHRDPLIDRAIHRGVDFLFSTDPTKADWPSSNSDKPSGNWWKFGFPVFYVTDLLQVVEALAALGHGRDARLRRLLALILSKQDAQGRWPLEYDYAGKTWVDFGAPKAPNKWTTLRALRVLKTAAAQPGRDST
jgi:hypothetical protein